MRYLLTSDLHYALRQLDWIADRAADFDAVVIAGDLLDAGAAADIHAQISLFTAYLRRLGEHTTVIANSGNHDLTARRPDGEKAALWMAEIGSSTVTDGEYVKVGGDLVSACAWWEGDETRREIEDQLERQSSIDRDGLWIWAYHSPPDGSPTAWGGTRSFGDEVLNGLIERFGPDLVLTGHVHEAPFRPDGSWHDRIGSTTIVNAGRQPGPVPSHVVIDTAARRAEWWSFEGSDELGF